MNFEQQDASALREALERLATAAQEYTPREDHNWVCEIRTAAVGWKQGEPPVIRCECGRDDLDAAIETATEVLAALPPSEDEIDARILAQATAESAGKDLRAISEPLLPPSAPPGLDVERLRQAMITAGLGVPYNDADPIETEHATEVAAEYARLEQDHP